MKSGGYYLELERATVFLGESRYGPRLQLETWRFWKKLFALHANEISGRNVSVAMTDVPEYLKK